MNLSYARVYKSTIDTEGNEYIVRCDVTGDEVSLGRFRDLAKADDAFDLEGYDHEDYTLIEVKPKGDRYAW